MRAERLGAGALVIVLLAAGALGWALQLQPRLRVDASALATLPERIGPWRSVELPVDATVESVLRADFNLQRAYFGPGDEPVWLYLGYYGTARGGRPEHTPRGCYTGAGWEIESTRVVEVVPGTEHRAVEYVVHREGQRRLVHYWFRSHRRTGIVSGLEQNLDRIAGRLLDGRADGALVRLSTPLDDEIAARARLLAFGADLDPLLAERWPEEH